jgi:hypothetical protein
MIDLELTADEAQFLAALLRIVSDGDTPRVSGAECDTLQSIADKMRASSGSGSLRDCAFADVRQYLERATKEPHDPALDCVIEAVALLADYLENARLVLVPGDAA